MTEVIKLLLFSRYLSKQKAMELLSTPANQHLLSTSITSLHKESRQWIGEIRFWIDELRFFYKLLQIKEARASFPLKDLAEIEKEVISILTDKIDVVQEGVISHERLLSFLTKSKSAIEEQVYRETHNRLLQQVVDLSSAIRILKEKVFKFVIRHLSD